MGLFYAYDIVAGMRAMTGVEAWSKSPGVAGMFYPADADQCRAQVQACLQAAAKFAVAPKALIAPHAGYIYSGAIAASAYATLAGRRGQISRVVLLGPNHRVAVRGMALSSAQSWLTPLGVVPLDRALLDRLARLPDVEVADAPLQQEHSLEVHLPFLQQVLGEFQLVPVLVGDATPDSVARLLREAWGGPETLIVISSDLSHYHDYATAQQSDSAAAQAIESLRPDLLKDEQACGNRALRGFMLEAQRRDLRVTALDLRNSGDTAGDKQRVVGYGSFAAEYADTARLDPAYRRGLLDAALAAIDYGIKQGAQPNVTLRSVPQPLLAMRATFVTLTLKGELRGCIGAMVPQRPLILDVMHSAYRAAFSDPRFAPLSAQELAQLEIEISILSTPRLIEAASEQHLLKALRPDKDGLIIDDAGRRALFLPKVWQAVPQPQAFLQHLKAKAGMPAEHWSDNFRAYRFTTETFGRQPLQAAA
jgi:AmmeMemoRadiSam system protein B/AmmeMemoRadiSam system protein A